MISSYAKLWLGLAIAIWIGAYIGQVSVTLIVAAQVAAQEKTPRIIIGGF